MSGIQIVLEIGLVVLLAITLFQAIRLERALGVLKRGRSALEPLVEEFDASTRQAEAAIARLHDAAEGVGRQIGRQADTALSLKDDLAFLVERGDRLADRIDGLVRAARPLATERPRLVTERALAERGAAERGAVERGGVERGVAERADRPPAPRPAAEAPPMQTLAEAMAASVRGDGERVTAERGAGERVTGDRASGERMTGESRARVRSQAERDLLKALRVAR